MTDQDMINAAVIGLAIVLGSWPAAARALGLVVLFGLVCFG
jgi:hypothetical protein